MKMSSKFKARSVEKDRAGHQTLPETKFYFYDDGCRDC